MKKKTDLQTVAGEPRAHRTGPVKEKAQITVRLDQQLMKRVNAQLKSSNMRLTDMVERGLQLAVGEAESLPSLTSAVRFVLANATKEQSRLILGLAVAMVEHEVIERSDADARIYELTRWFLEERNLAAHRQTSLDLYSRYGKSVEGAAKLG